MSYKTVTVTRKVRIRYYQFDGSNVDEIGEFLESKGTSGNSVDFAFHSRKGYMRAIVDHTLREIKIGNYVLWDVYAQRFKVMTEEEFKDYTRNYENKEEATNIG